MTEDLVVSEVVEDRVARGMAVDAAVTVVHLTTVPETLRFLGGMLGFLQRGGYRVHVVSSPGEELDAFAALEGVDAHGIEMPRRITPGRDLRAVGRLATLFREIRPSIVHAHTPKAGLLGMIAACLTRAPVRIYHVHGLPFVTARGWRRVLLRWSERASCALATDVLCVSNSVRRVAVDARLCAPAKMCVLLNGSIAGVDAKERFNPSAHREARAAVRERHGIPSDARVIGYVGRVVSDKGIAELAAAWEQLRNKMSDLHLLIVGPFEQQDRIPPDVEKMLLSDRRIHVAGLDWNTPPLYAAMDVVVLPSYREGFPVVPLEAAAMALPVVATSIPGCVDAIVDGETGTLVPARDDVALERAMERYLADPQLRRAHGDAARARVLESFQREALWRATMARYERLLRETGTAAQRPSSQAT